MKINEAGSILVSFLLLFPTLIMVVFAVLLFTSIAGAKQEKLHLCRKQLIQMSTQKAASMNKLLSMNKEARRLRKQRKIANTSYKTAKMTKNPKAIALAIAFLELTKSQQKIHKMRQYGTLTKSIAQQKLKMSTIYSEFKMKKAKVDLLSSMHSLPVYSRGDSTGSPTYHARANTEKLSKSEAHWSFEMPRHLKFILKKLNVDQQKIYGSCASTIRKRGGQWRSELRAAKES